LTRPRSDARPRPSVLSIRVRLTLIAVIVVALVLAISGAGVIYWQHRSILDQQQARLNTETASVALAVSQHRAISGALRPGTGVQVVDQYGNVVASSDSLSGQPPISNVRPPVGTREQVRPRSTHLGGDEDLDLVNAETISTNRGNETIYTVVFGSRIESSTKSLIVGLAIVLPIALILLGVLIWILIGLALRPIDRMRATVDSLAEDELDLRVPVPPGDDEVARLAITLNEMLQRLEVAQKRQRGFISDASHELRSPIASLLATVEVARAHPDSANWDAVSQVVTAEGRRLSRLVDDLLTLAASEENRDTHLWQTVDLDELLFAEADRLRLQGSLTVEISSISAARVFGDPVQLDRAVRNVVDNAVRHAKSIIRLGLTTDGSIVRLTVSDDGPGIDPADAERLFQRFSRVDSARDRPSGGTGLGLAIVASVMASHGGAARFVPAEEGATVELTLPAMASEISRPSEEEGDPLPAQSNGLRHR
jgi:signal transduction histidine kinase